MKKIVILTGAGISAESGISTFRDTGGLWEQYDINDVCTPEAFERHPELVLDFYNQRREQLLNSRPNEGHYNLVQLEKEYDVQIITQNVDNLHEQAGSTKVLHLHGELMKVRSSGDDHLIYNLNKENYRVLVGDLCEKGFQLRPHIVFFGEAVPLIETAAQLCSNADILMIVGTSLQVYPAAGLIDYAPKHCHKYYIDPQPTISAHAYPKLHLIAEKASTGTAKAISHILSTNEN